MVDKKNEVKFDFYNRPVMEIQSVEYDDIVDRSSFQPSAELKRTNRITSATPGGAQRPLYDFVDNSRSRTEFLSDIEIALRDGKLDRADVQKLKELAQEQGATDIDRKIEESEQEQVRKRSDKVDEILGLKE